MLTMPCFASYDYVNVGIFVIDPGFNIVFWNKSLQELSGIAKANITGKNLLEVFKHLDNNIFKVRLNGIFQGGPPEFFSSQLNKYIIPIKLNNGEFRTQHASVMGAKVPNSNEIVAVFSLIDISDEKKQIENYKEMKNKVLYELEEKKKVEDKLNLTVAELENKSLEIQKTNNELHQINASKDKFFSIIAHDLKNPLSAIMAYSEWLFDEYENLNDEEVLDAISSIKSSSKNLYGLLENLLNWSRLKVGRMEYEPEWFSLSELIEYLLSIFEMSAYNKNVTLKMNVVENIKLFADKNMISTVIRNLISNAIKFTHRNGDIEIFATKENKHIIIKIIDSGIGMSKTQLEDVFNIESSFSTPGTEKEEGTGLGLILCKELVEFNKGIMDVESTVGQGTTFTLHFKVL